MKTIGVIGAGAWGTALAQTLSTAGCEVLLWAREAEVVDDVNRRHANAVFLPGVALTPGLAATNELGAVAACDVILMVAPTQFVRSVSASLDAAVAGKPVVICAKGLEQASGKLLGNSAGRGAAPCRPVVMSGPSFAADVARGLPAALTLATADRELGGQLAALMASRTLRLYWTDDLVGTQLGGAVKNVLAIAAGIVAGRKLGDSAHAALVTRGFAELRRFGEALGARADTLMGLSGLGDLLLTCGSLQSRNMSLGHALGQGQLVAGCAGRAPLGGGRRLHRRRRDQGRRRERHRHAGRRRRARHSAGPSDGRRRDRSADVATAEGGGLARCHSEAAELPRRPDRERPTIRTGRSVINVFRVELVDANRYYTLASRATQSR